MENMEEACVEVANELILRCCLPMPRLAKAKGIGSRLLLLVVEYLNGKALPGSIPFPKCHYDKLTNIECVMNVLSQFRLDLSHISAERIVAGDLADCYKLLSILKTVLDDVHISSELQVSEVESTYKTVNFTAEDQTGQHVGRLNGSSQCDIPLQSGVVTSASISSDGSVRQSPSAVADLDPMRPSPLSNNMGLSNMHQLTTTEVNLMRAAVSGSIPAQPGSVQDGEHKVYRYKDTRVHTDSPGFSSPSPLLPPACAEDMFRFAEVGASNKVTADVSVSDEGKGTTQWGKGGNKQQPEPKRGLRIGGVQSDPGNGGLEKTVLTEYGRGSQAAVSRLPGLSQADVPPVRDNCQRLPKKVSKQLKKNRSQELPLVQVQVNIKPRTSRSLIDLRLGSDTSENVTDVDHHTNSFSSKSSVSAFDLTASATDHTSSVITDGEGGRRFQQARQSTDQTQKSARLGIGTGKDCKNDATGHRSVDKQVHSTRGANMKTPVLDKGCAAAGRSLPCSRLHRHTKRVVLSELEKLCESVSKYLDKYSHEKENVSQSLSSSEQMLGRKNTSQSVAAHDQLQGENMTHPTAGSSSQHPEYKPHPTAAPGSQRSKQLNCGAAVPTAQNQKSPKCRTSDLPPSGLREPLTRPQTAPAGNRENLCLSARAASGGSERQGRLSRNQNATGERTRQQSRHRKCWGHAPPRGQSLHMEDEPAASSVVPTTDTGKLASGFGTQTESWHRQQTQHMTASRWPLTRKKKTQILTPAQKLSLQKQVKRKCVTTGLTGVPTRPVAARVQARKLPARRHIRLRIGRTNSHHQEDVASEPEDLLEYLLDKFPCAHLSPVMLRRMQKQYQQKLRYMSNSLLSSYARKNPVQSQLEDVVKRQQQLEDLQQREVILDSRIQEQKERSAANQKVQGYQRDQRIQRAQARRYFTEFLQQHRGKMLGQRTREEMLLKSVFEEMLKIQQEKLLALRKEQQESQQEVSQLAYERLQAIQELYDDHLRSLMDCVAKEKQVYARNQQCFKQQVKNELRNFRKRVEEEVHDTLGHIHKEDQDIHFRELDAECLKDNLHRAKWKFE